MTMFCLRILDSDVDRIGRLLFADDCEAAVLAICGRSRVRDPWSREERETFLLREIIEVPSDAYDTRAPDGFTWSTTPFFRALKHSDAKDQAVAVIHGHPAGHLSFSERDDIAEQELFRIAFAYRDSDQPHVSIIIDRNGGMAARAYGPDLKPRLVGSIVTIGQRWRLFGPDNSSIIIGAEFDRQVRAFGRQATIDLARARIGVVGCGGTGSAMASLLARIGVRRLALFDADTIDETNLNRLQFSSRYDANLSRRKVDVVAEGIATIGLPISIVRVPHFIDHPDALKVARTCDIVFGCTDDHLGREVLNRLAHFYFIPVIDLGLLIQPSDQGGYDTFDGRVTVVQPGYPCQNCRGLIDDSQIFIDGLRRDPEVFEARRRAGYVPTNDDPSPVVVGFSMEVATMAVNELFHRLTGFRGADQSCSERVRRFDLLKDSDTLPAGKPKSGCKLCQRRLYDGRGDMTPLLDLTL
jgi:molybdopterin/thiamine biosynthesis adenylyltransferase